MARRWMLRSMALALLALAARPEGAGAITITGATLVPAPTQIKRDALEDSSGMLVFAEKQNYVLTKDLKLGKSGTIEAGTAVDVYYVSFDPETLKTLTAKVGFGGVEILGFAKTTAQLNRTDFLGNAGTTYDRYRFRGLETGPGTSNRDRVKLSTDRTELDFDIRTLDPGDVVRVIIPTQVPEPGTLLLLSAGLGGIAAVRRRRAA